LPRPALAAPSTPLVPVPALEAVLRRVVVLGGVVVFEVDFVVVLVFAGMVVLTSVMSVSKCGESRSISVRRVFTVSLPVNQP